MPPGRSPRNPSAFVGRLIGVLLHLGQPSRDIVPRWVLVMAALRPIDVAAAVTSVVLRMLLTTGIGFLSTVRAAAGESTAPSTGIRLVAAVSYAGPQMLRVTVSWWLVTGLRAAGESTGPCTDMAQDVGARPALVRILGGQE